MVAWLAQNWDALMTVLNMIGLLVLQKNKAPK